MWGSSSGMSGSLHSQTEMNEVVCDEEGNLKSSLTFDDIHLYGSKYGIWVDYLKENGI
jgi:hypothetical protein